ncbi:hypothetical protein CP965_01995 [Halarcobacter mediterraneus]|uniref:Zona occludens toxin N-terminal domain-containing protein n=1 Tax=Halarcobacter mediterraneus TaxID=2023153 RepID=A0A4Q1AY15_9BACT|nr:zonular occludens toxin domain-containing protein [Halarcobacter mediterraneus]RXK14243.1 hypothetical protein CP965_01995 [Halarcobacter mediterraneus]
MITFITGFPGSGKTYFEIDKIYNILSNNHNLSKNIEVIYTNINGMKFDKFPSNNIELKKLHIEDFYKYLEESHKIYELYKNSDNVDEYLLKHTKEKGFFNALIVFDECHDFLSKQDKVKVYWLTYHRHLHHEIDLLTQNKSLINSIYRGIPEQFIEAQPRSKKLFSNSLSYKYYASFAMRKADLFNNSSIKTKKEVFDLYTSGNTSKQKSILVKFILIALIGLSATITLFVFVFYNLKVEENEPIKKEVKKIEKPISNETIRRVKNKFDFNNYVVEITYNSLDGYFINDNYYSIFHFKNFLRTTNAKILSRYNIANIGNYKVTKLYVRTNKEALKQFFLMPKIDEKNEIKDIKVEF